MRLHPQISLGLKSAVALLVASVLSSCLGSGFKGPDRSEQGVSRMTWAGLAENRVKLSTSRDKISMTWEAPRNARGNYYFEIYEGQAKDNRLKVTSDLSWDYPIDPTSSRCYHLSARAFDKDGGDTNASVVVVCNDYDGVPPEMITPYYAFQASHNAIYIWWPASPSLDLAKYNVYESKDIFDTNGIPKENPTPIASTVQNFIFIDKINGFDLLPNTQYKFVVEAVDGEGNESRARTIVSATTDFMPRPYFRGLIDVRRVAGVDGLTQLELIWLPTPDVTVTGYRIYQSSAENYGLPFTVGFVGPIVPVGGSSSGNMGPYVPRLTGGSPTLSTRIDGLSPDTQYCFVARAAVDGNPVNEEKNRLVRCQRTNLVKAPTFGGVVAAAPGNGDAGFTSGVVSWLPADTDGVHNKYLVTYKGFASDPNCSTANMTGATQVQTDFESDISWTIVGLTPQTYYCVQVNTLYDVPGTYLTDTNTVRTKFFTSPANPVHSGVQTVATSSGINGFSSLDVTWNQASGSFTRYTLEVSSTPDFAAPEKVINFPLITDTSTTVNGLAPKTNYYVRVTAYYIYAGPPVVTLPGSPSPKVMVGRTEPQAPNGDGVLSAVVSSPTSINIGAQLPTNPGALWDRHFVWAACGPTAVSKIQNLQNAVPWSESTPQIEDYPTAVLRTVISDPNQNSYLLSGLSENVMCCVQWRSHYGPVAGNELVSKSTRGYECRTPQLLPPPCTGAKAVVNSNLNTGFTQLKVTWDGLPSNDNFSVWRVAWATTEAAVDFNNPAQSGIIAGYATNEYPISGLTPHRTYFVKVRGEHTVNASTATCGSAAVRSGVTTPATPAAVTGWNGEPTGSTTARVTVKTPPDPALGGGLHNGGFIYWAESDAALLNIVNTRGVVNSAGKRVPVGLGTDVDFSMSGSSVDLGQMPRGIIWVSRTGNPLVDGPDTPNNLDLNGLIPEQNYVAHYRPVYWVPGNAELYVEGPLSSPARFTPVAQPPIFGGAESVQKYHDQRDFTQFKVTWTAPVGACDVIQISVTTGAEGQWDPPYATTSGCAMTEYEVFGLNPHTDYTIRARAVKYEATLPFHSGGDVAITAQTTPVRPSNEEAVTAVTVTEVPAMLDSATVTRSTPLSGDWTHLYVFRGSAVGSAIPATDTSIKNALITEVKAQTATFVNPGTGARGPTTQPYVKLTKAQALGSPTYVDSNLDAGTWYCYAVLAVHDSLGAGFPNDRFYLPSVKEGVADVVCDKPEYNEPPVTQVSAVNVSGTCGNGAPKVRLTLTNGLLNNHSIESFSIYIAPGTTLGDFGDLSKGPWETIYGSTEGSTTFSGDTLEVCSNNLVAGTKAFLARWNYVGSPGQDTNNNFGTIGAGVPSDGAHWVWVTKSRSGLPYDYLMMNYEAVLTSGSLGSPVIPESGLATCNANFHNSGTLTGCGTGPDPVTVRAVKSSAPTAANWHQAWWACRKSSSGPLLSRLPTEEEWRRASKWNGDAYTSLVTGGVPMYVGQCNTTSDAVGTNGDRSNCKNSIGIHDLAGRRREWVDARVKNQSVAARFSYAPTVARLIDNGIDRLTYQLHYLVPGAGVTLGLLMGSDYVSDGGGFEKQYDAETQYWDVADTATAVTGFRCMAFLKSHLPSDIVNRMALPREPTYAGSDYSGSPTTWKIPETRYAGDTRPESVGINVAVENPPSGSVDITWPYWKIYADGSEVSLDQPGNYEIYRILEPTHFDSRFATPWAMAQGPYSAGAVALDPLAVDGTGARIFTPAGGTISCAGGTCSWSDGLSGADGRRLFNYILVAKKSYGGDVTLLPGRVQRFLSPYYVGTTAGSGRATAYFRTENRWRRASVGAVSEGYQMTLSPPQVMAHVPMDQSGLDHDFYIQAYEAAIASGGFGDNSFSFDPAAYLPVNNRPEPGTSSTWSNNTARCYDMTNRGVAGLDDGACGTLSTDAVFKSAAGVMPIGSGGSGAPNGASYASLFAACRLSKVSDGTYNYPMRMVSASEFFQAASWGDMNFDGTVDQNPYVAAGSNVVDIEMANNAFVSDGCRDDEFDGVVPANNSVATTGGRSKCISRHGVADIVGNAFEQSAERNHAGVGLDNGLDGLWLNTDLNNLAHAYVDYFTNSGPYDLFRAIDTPSGMGAVISSINNHMSRNSMVAESYHAAFLGCGRSDFQMPNRGFCGRFSRHGDAGARPLHIYYKYDSGGRCAR